MLLFDLFSVNTMVLIIILSLLIPFVRPDQSNQDNTIDNIIQWSKIQVSIKNKSILTMNDGQLLSSRLVGLLGPSGSGKSTFLNVLSGNHIFVYDSFDGVFCFFSEEIVINLELYSASHSYSFLCCDFRKNTTQKEWLYL